MFLPHGIFNAMATPFDSAGELDIPAVRQFTEFCCTHGDHGLFPVSNVGEFLLMDETEKSWLIEAVCETNAGRLFVTPGIGNVTVKRSLDLARVAKENGADGVVLCPPYFYPYGTDYVFAYLMEVVERSPLPVLLYHQPVFCRPIAFEDTMRLLRHENVVAVKESSGDMRLFQRILDRVREENIAVRVMVGTEELLYPALTVGAAGCAVTSGGVVPELLRLLYDAFARGDRQTCLFAQRSIRVVAEAMGAIGFPFGYKLGARARGIPMGVTRGLGAYERGLEPGYEVLCGVIEAELGRFGFSRL